MSSCLLESVGAVNQLEILQNYKNKVYVNLVILQRTWDNRPSFDLFSS